MPAAQLGAAGRRKGRRSLRTARARSGQWPARRSAGNGSRRLGAALYAVRCTLCAPWGSAADGRVWLARLRGVLGARRAQSAQCPSAPGPACMCTHGRAATSATAAAAAAQPAEMAHRSPAGLRSRRLPVLRTSYFALCTLYCRDNGTPAGRRASYGTLPDRRRGTRAAGGRA